MRLFALPLLALFALVPLASASPQHFQSCVSMTGRTATLLVPAAVAPVLGGQTIQPGDELAVFTPEGLCAGAAVWTGGALAVAIWENDPGTEAPDGFEPGEPLVFRAWRAATGEEYAASNALYHADYETDGTFVSDGIYLVEHFAFGVASNSDETGPLAFDLAPAYPNPFHTQTTLEYTLPAAHDVRLEVFDLLGRRVAVLVDEHQPAGRYTTSFHAEGGLAAGVYVGRLRAGAQTALARFTLVR